MSSILGKTGVTPFFTFLLLRERNSEPAILFYFFKWEKEGKRENTFFLFFFRLNKPLGHLIFQSRILFCFSSQQDPFCFPETVV